MPKPEEQLKRFVGRYDPAISEIAFAALDRLRQQLPGAIELVYDNYNALAVGFSPSDKPSHAVVSLALYPRWVSLFLLDGAALPDPSGILKGQGRKVRHIVLRDADDLDLPAVRTLVTEAAARSEMPFPGTGTGRIVIQSVSSRQRPRRPQKLR